MFKVSIAHNVKMYLARVQSLVIKTNCYGSQSPEDIRIHVTGTLDVCTGIYGCLTADPGHEAPLSKLTILTQGVPDPDGASAIPYVRDPRGPRIRWAPPRDRRFGVYGSCLVDFTNQTLMQKATLARVSSSNEQEWVWQRREGLEHNVPEWVSKEDDERRPSEAGGT